MSNKTVKDMTTAELVAEQRKLTALKAWGAPLNEINRELHDRQPVELAQDAYYYGTAADLRRNSVTPIRDTQSNTNEGAN